MRKKRLSIMLDVEHSGPSVTLHDPVSFALVVVEEGEPRGIEVNVRPERTAFRQSSYDAIGYTRAMHEAHPMSQREGALALLAWLKTLEAESFSIVSDNNGNDWMWLNEFILVHGGVDKSPLGWSSRRIGCFAAGVNRNWTAAQDWKKGRITPHTHRPLDDAKGNVEALIAFCQENDIPRFWGRAR